MTDQQGVVGFAILFRNSNPSPARLMPSVMRDAGSGTEAAGIATPPATSEFVAAKKVAAPVVGLMVSIWGSGSGGKLPFGVIKPNKVLFTNADPPRCPVVGPTGVAIPVFGLRVYSSALVSVVCWV